MLSLGLAYCALSQIPENMRVKDVLSRLNFIFMAGVWNNTELRRLV